MIPLATLDDIALLRESFEVECKLAVGQDGRGRLPADFWPTYSAFANLHGGFVILGLRERGDDFELVGVPDSDRVRTDLFNQLNNRQKVSVNLLTDDDVQSVTIDGRTLLVIEVPPATRKDKPVHVNGNPMTGTYRRLHDGDRACDAETVRRMLAEQTEDSRDTRVLQGFGIDDLVEDTVRAYRQMLRDRSPAHPFLEADDTEFLRRIGALRRDREREVEGLSIAGLLMFGKGESIRDEFPNYFVDYQERAAPRAEVRWIDRVTVDGTWSGNLFDFYRRVYRKLIADLRVPFVLRDGQRQDETTVHEALREALVNTIVHADYTGRASVLVVKRPDMFGFRNPGLMRVPIIQAIVGGESDGRNRTLQNMFLLVGAGERAGSGVPKIHKGWADQHWRPPALYEREEPSEQTLLELRMIDLIPTAELDRLRERFGQAFDALTREQRLILATAASEDVVTHSRLLPMCGVHATDLSRTLQGLVRDRYLQQSGRTRGAVYRLPGTSLPSPDTVFGPVALEAVVAEAAGEGWGLKPKDPDLEPKGPDLKPKDPDLEPKGPDLKGPDIASNGSELAEGGPNLGVVATPGPFGRQVEGLPYPLIDDLEPLDRGLRRELDELSDFVSGSGKVSPDISRRVIERLCRGRFLTIKVISALLHRNEDYLRKRILNPMVEERVLIRAFPQTPNDPRQAYAVAPDP